MNCKGCGNKVNIDKSGGTVRTPDAIPTPPVVLYRWLFLTWYGIPKPIRLLNGLKNQQGCGCIKLLKDLWEDNRYFYKARPVATKIPRPERMRKVHG